MPNNKFTDIDVFSFIDKKGKTWYVVLYFIDDIFSDEYRKIHIRLFRKKENSLRLLLENYYVDWIVLLKNNVIELKDVKLVSEIRNRGIMTRLIFILCKMFPNIKELRATDCLHDAIAFWKRIGFERYELDNIYYKIQTCDFMNKFKQLESDVVIEDDIEDRDVLDEIYNILERQKKMGNIT